MVIFLASDADVFGPGLIVNINFLNATFNLDAIYK